MHKLTKKLVEKSKTGIYILTYPGDYHLALPLIKSLEYFNPDLLVTIVAGNGFNINDHPFKGKDIFQPDPEKWSLFADYDKKFALFDGPYERFLYLDADILCLREISGIFRKMDEDEAQDIRSIYVNLPNKDYGTDANTSEGDDRKIKINNGQIGNLDSIELFDPEYANDLLNHYPFNTGVFAASKSLFNYEELLDYKKREMDFFKNILKRPYNCKNSDLFYVDQGKLNYLVWKKNLKVQSLYPDAHYIWGGKPFPFSLEQVLSGECSIPFIHWAGCPRPSSSIFNRAPLFYFYAKMWGFLKYPPTFTATVPGKEVWNFFNTTNLAAVFKFSLKDLNKLFPIYFSAFKRRIFKLFYEKKDTRPGSSYR